MTVLDRIALNMNQVEEYQPPENPAKVTDSRFRGYVDVYGYSSWELDALAPEVLEQIVEDKITEFIDYDLWEKVERLEKYHKEKLMRIAGKIED